MLKKHKEGVVLRIHAQPKASKTEFSGFYGDSLKLKIQQPPADGLANQACIKYIADFFKTAKSNVILINGEKSREKEFLLFGFSEETVLEILKQRGLK